VVRIYRRPARHHSDYVTSGERQEEREVELRAAAGSTFARASSATFHVRGVTPRRADG